MLHNLYKDLAKEAGEENLRVSITSELVEQVMEAVHTNIETLIVQEDQDR